MKYTRLDGFKLLVLIISLFLFISRSWAGEDSFIFFKYIDNLINGHGLVFNIGERVEGFTSPLWVFVLALLRFITGFELRPIAIVLGLILSTLSVYLLLKYDNKGKYIFPIGVLILISNSAFRDYATSGFETSLSYLLVVVLALLVKNDRLWERPLLVGVAASLLVLNRPETFLIFLYLLLLYAFHLAKYYKSTRATPKSGGTYYPLQLLLKFMVFPTVLLGSYQAFRILYYSEFFPNTFYAKKGAELYINQGMNYVLDFAKSYPITLFIIFALLAYSVYKISKARNSIYKESTSRYHLTAMAALLISYVLYSGGDYMHGRSLILPFLLLCISVNDVLDAEYEKYFSKVQDTSGYIFITSVISGVVLIVGLLQKPLTVREGQQINYINDERTHFGFNFRLIEFSQYLGTPITGEFGWRDRGYYYKEISEAVDMPISVVMPNIGYFGYAAGENVKVLGGVLIDPYLAKKPVETRGKIGHEDSTDWDYLFSLKPTFSYTPFPYWNKHAQFKYYDAPHASIIKDDSDGSFVPVFDLSNKEFLKRFSEIVGVDVKDRIDKAQIEFMSTLANDEIKKGWGDKYGFEVNDYLDFLNKYWYPYARISDQNIFERVYKK